ncbi:hypothetical protein FACS1894116_06040 [Betaproteobacteria bacterium]|nr:hypothetical protein FACS1894116_06040 [Betaproteobacteria bacterium]GHT98209.1 hypothetical protein FACS1894154_03110 [Betaproteobacteria bacterium]
MVAKFTYGDAVKVKLSSDPVLKPGQLASIVGVYDKEELKKGGKWEGGIGSLTGLNRESCT